MRAADWLTDRFPRFLGPEVMLTMAAEGGKRIGWRLGHLGLIDHGLAWFLHPITIYTSLDTFTTISEMHINFPNVVCKTNNKPPKRDRQTQTHIHTHTPTPETHTHTQTDIHTDKVCWSHNPQIVTLKSVMNSVLRWSVSRSVDVWTLYSQSLWELHIPQNNPSATR